MVVKSVTESLALSQFSLVLQNLLNTESPIVVSRRQISICDKMVLDLRILHSSSNVLNNDIVHNF